MTWWQFALLGSVGGALAEVLAVFGWINAWQAARRSRAGRLKGKPPKWRTYVDLPVHFWMLAIRLPLGAGAALLFGMTGQIGGAYAAVAFGFAAPAILAQLGTVPQIVTAVTGERKRLENNRPAAEIAPHSGAEFAVAEEVAVAEEGGPR